MVDPDIRIHEITFCGRVAKWAESMFKDSSALPFERAEIEESKGIKRKRSDLRFYAPNNQLVLAGEVKLPGTPEGMNPYNSAFVEDAYLKASNSGARFFFTWNVNLLVLFDSSLWEKPLYERRVREFTLGLELDNPYDVSRPEVEKAIRDFLPAFFAELAQIYRGEKPDWGMPPDEYFIRAFESHISWPVRLTADYLMAKSEKDRSFDRHLQGWMANDQDWLVIRNDAKAWRTLIDRAARTLCYVFSNRLLFYESVQARFTELKKLGLPKKTKPPDDLYTQFQKLFQRAVEVTGDYETIFYPQEKDWAGPTIFGHEDSAYAWRSVIQNLEPFNLRQIPTDILGGIFKRLIAPEERHKFGQHYTSEDLVDVINAFCIHNGDDRVLDPACGSGSFLVRAYQRKAWLKPSSSHQDRVSEIFGVDVSLFAAHLSTLNLAARDISNEDNYPRIARRNFFDVRANNPFCQLPHKLKGKTKMSSIFLPSLNAVVGNPPYVRQELIPKRSNKGVKPMQAKEDLQELCSELWPGLKLGGRSDLHCYFWPASAIFLEENGWFGFLVSSSWLDVEYGFALQGWILQNFKIHAILESNAEPWFEDSRVKTCAVILQRCSDPKERKEQLVKFVRLNVSLNLILGERIDENSRQKAAEKYRDLIMSCKDNKTCAEFRIVVIKQGNLWDEGLRAGRLFQLQKQRNLIEGINSESAEEGEVSDEDEAIEEGEKSTTAQEAGFPTTLGSGYGGGKWGKYLRAPDLYFEIMEKYGDRFVPLGKIAVIRRGITSGCDAFFMPKGVSGKFLKNYSKAEWNNAALFSHCKRSEVESGKVRLILAGDGTVHPVESEYLAPEVHSLMKITRPLILAENLDQLVLLVSEPLKKLRGTYVYKYLQYGEQHTFSSKKSKAVPVSKRPTCAARNPWYDLTNNKRGDFVWPKSQQYRHVVLYNSDHLIVNCNLYDVTLVDQKSIRPKLFAGVLNSTIVGLMKVYFGRYAGTEGNLKTEVVDVNLLEVPDPRYAPEAVAIKIEEAFNRLCQRDTQPMVEEEFMSCRSSERAKKLADKPISLPKELTMSDRRDLDLAVYELLGVSEAQERRRLCDELYFETAKHFRQIRIVEIQKQEQRAKSGGREFKIDELAADLWDALSDEEKQPLVKWISEQFSDGFQVTIPVGLPSLPDAFDMLDPNTVFFRQGKGKQANVTKLSCSNRHNAEIVYLLSSKGLSGKLALPEDESVAKTLYEKLDSHLAQIAAKTNELSLSKTGDEQIAVDLCHLLEHWIIHGKPQG